jgi:hypothetical protein
MDENHSNIHQVIEHRANAELPHAIYKWVQSPRKERLDIILYIHDCATLRSIPGVVTMSTACWFRPCMSVTAVQKF